MRKFLKIIGVLLLGFVALLALATMVLKIAFPPAKLRHIVEEQIRKQLHRAAQIGPVDLGVYGISAGRLKLSNVPDFSAGTFLYVEKTSIHWALAPLVHKTLVIETVALDQPQIDLVRMADGKTLNISDLKGAPSAPPSPARGEGVSNRHPLPNAGEGGSAGGGWSWVVEKIELRKGAIRLDDRSPAHMTSALENIDLTLHDLTASAVQGQLSVASLQNPVYTAKNLSVDWNLTDIDPSWAHLNGAIHLKQGPGQLQNVTDLAASSSMAKLFLMPILMLQNLDRLGLLHLGLPDFSHLPISDIVGVYQFHQGTLRIETFKINGPQLSLTSQGTVQLASGALNVDVEMNAPQRSLLGETHLKMHLSGTLSHPQTDLKDLKKKAFKATVNQLLQNPKTLDTLNNTLKQIFH